MTYVAWDRINTPVNGDFLAITWAISWFSVLSGALRTLA